MPKFGDYAADIADRAIKGGAALEGVTDATLRIALPQGGRIVVRELQEALAGTMIPAENAAGEAYEITVLDLLRSLLVAED